MVAQKQCVTLDWMTSRGLSKLKLREIENSSNRDLHVPVFCLINQLKNYSTSIPVFLFDSFIKSEQLN